MSHIKVFFHKLLSVCLDILPLLAVIFFFQTFVIQKPFPHLEQTLLGIVFVVMGLFLFILGLENALFPMGEKIAAQFTQKGNVGWVILFGFLLGFSTTIAEPALTVIAKKAGRIVADSGAIVNDISTISSFVYGLRLSVAFSVGLATALGVIRIIRGWPLVWFIVAGYGLIVIATLFAPKQIIGIAYDSGGITTSTVTVPLVTALGIGLSVSIRGRNPMIDGFGLIALASLTPILFVMIFGMITLGVQ
ncbi:MAG: membrane protein [Nitrospinaceae bacterium]|nr:MAG: membrane protein [Nitrospinaceae bacterium]